jgi:hypothetical protein
MSAPASRPVANYFTRVATESLRGMARGANMNVWEMGGASGSEWAGQAAGQAAGAVYDQKVKAPAMQYLQRTTIPGMVAWWAGSGNNGPRQ